MQGETGSPASQFRRTLGATIVVALFVGLLTTGTAWAAANKSRAILFVHGYNATSNSTDCGGDFDTMISQLRSEGFTGSMVKVGFYTNDTNCNVNLHSYGSSYSDSSSWKAIAKAFSYYVYNTFTSQGIDVTVVGYSMGGLITRGAVYGSQKGESGFSAPIRVVEGVTLAAPHNGAAWYSALCLWGQCSTFKPGATDITWLNGNGNPQGATGTDWTVIGSSSDSVVPLASALYMTLPATNKVTYSNVPHTGSTNYMHTSAVVTRSGNALANVGQ